MKPRSRRRSIVAKVKSRVSAFGNNDPITRVTAEKIDRVSREAASLWREGGAQRGGRPRPELRSQYGEDVVLWELLRPGTQGFFVEAGAFDGYAFSVTYVLECIGWHGLLVEALPDQAEACRARRPHSRVVNAALARPGSPPTTSFTRVLGIEMLSYDELTASQASRLQRERGLATEAIEVPTATLDRLGQPRRWGRCRGARPGGWGGRGA